MKLYSAGEVAKLLRVPYYTLNNLEKTGKIPLASRTTSNQRIYTEDDILELKRILEK